MRSRKIIISLALIGICRSYASQPEHAKVKQVENTSSASTSQQLIATDASASNTTNALTRPSNFTASLIEGNSGVHDLCRTPTKSSFKDVFGKLNDINARNDHGMTPLHIVVASVASKTAQGQRKILKAQGDKTREQSVPFHLEFIRELLKRGASVDAQDNDGMQAIHYALRPEVRLEVENDNVLVPIVRTLVDFGANQQAKWGNKTPKFLLAVRSLEEGGYIIDGRNTILREALDEEPTVLGKSFKGEIDELQKMAQEGYPLGIVNSTGDTALHRAVEGAQDAAISFLLKEKVINVNATNGSKQTPLHRAACLGILNAARALVGAGANARLQDGHGKTPLHYATEHLQREMIELLVDHTGLNSLDFDGHSPLFSAVAFYRGTEEEQSRALDIIEILLEKGATPSVVQLLSDSPNRQFCKSSLLDCALRNRNIVIMRKLFNQQKHRKELLKTVNQPVSESGYEYSLLHRAVRGAYNLPLEISINFLVSHGAKTYSKDSLGRLPIFYLINRPLPVTQECAAICLLLKEKESLCSLEEDAISDEGIVISPWTEALFHGDKDALKIFAEHQKKWNEENFESTEWIEAEFNRHYEALANLGLSPSEPFIRVHDLSKQ